MFLDGVIRIWTEPMVSQVPLISYAVSKRVVLDQGILRVVHLAALWVSEAYVGATAEVRFPFPFIPDNLGLSGAVFADAGMLFDPVSSSNTVVTDDTIRSSVGGSVLWDSPMGPLRMDFAYVLTKEDYDQTQIFSFGAATKF